MKTEAGYSKNTIKNMRNLISGVMELAIEDKIVGTNPAARSGKYQKAAKKARKAEFLTPEEVRLLLDNARGVFYPFFLTAARTGLRQGELIGLRWDDIDWNGKFLTVKRTMYRKQEKIPKSGKERKVDMSDRLLEVLKDHKKAMTAEALRPGTPFSPYVFTSRNKTPHGASLTYVKEQMGHHSISVTVDVYGHLIPSANRAEVNKLDDSGTRNLQPGATRANSGLQVVDKLRNIKEERKQADFA